MTSTPQAALRSCGDCCRCCIDMRIGDKAAGVPCPQIACVETEDGVRRCGCYADRPEACSKYECLWRLVGVEVLLGHDRPNVLGVIFSARLASELGLPPHGTGDWLVIAALPAYVTPGRPLEICTNAKAMEAIRRLRVAGLAVLIDESACGGEQFVEPPLRKPTAEFAHRLAVAVHARWGESDEVSSEDPATGKGQQSATQGE